MINTKATAGNCFDDDNDHDDDSLEEGGFLVLIRQKQLLSLLQC